MYHLILLLILVFFSSKDRNKWDFVKHQKFHNLAVLNDALVFIHAKVIHKHELCSNTIFIAEIIDAKLNNDGNAILYQDYHKILYITKQIC